MKLDNLSQTVERNMQAAGLRIICITLNQDDCYRSVYRVFTSDGSCSVYQGYDKLPPGLKAWLSERNAFDYVLPGCMFVSGCKVVQYGSL